MKHISNKTKFVVSVFLGLASIAFCAFLPSVLAQTLPPPPPPPSMAPPVPAGLTGSSPAQTQVNLSWGAVVDGWLSGYNVYRCAGAGCTPTVKVGTTNATTTTYSDSGLTVGTYVYGVTAYSGFGESAQSTPFQIATQVKTYSIADFTALVGNWLKNGSGLAGDVNADNTVNTRDVGIMMSYWSAS